MCQSMMLPSLLCCYAAQPATSENTYIYIFTFHPHLKLNECSTSLTRGEGIVIHECHMRPSHSHCRSCLSQSARENTATICCNRVTTSLVQCQKCIFKCSNKTWKCKGPLLFQRNTVHVFSH